VTVPESITRGWWLGMAAEMEQGAVQMTADAEAAKALGQPYSVDIDNHGHYAQLARLVGGVEGWGDPRIPGWIAKEVARRFASGGYGLNVAYDAFGDGTTNPAGTTYGITTCDFVGIPLFPAFDHGVLAQADLDAIIDCCLSWPQTNGHPDYSRHANDHGKASVWNVGAAMAAFLLNARSRTDGFNAGGTPVPGSRSAACLSLGVAWRNKVTAAYIAGIKGWPYCSGLPNPQVRQDGGHNAVCCDLLVPWIGDDEADLQVYTGPLTYGQADYIGGVMRLLYLPSVQERVNDFVGNMAVLTAASATPGSAVINGWHALCVHNQHA
jgi:hypothetical protein